MVHNLHCNQLRFGFDITKTCGYNSIQKHVDTILLEGHNLPECIASTGKSWINRREIRSITWSVVNWCVSSLETVVCWHKLVGLSWLLSCLVNLLNSWPRISTLHCSLFPSKFVNILIKESETKIDIFYQYNMVVQTTFPSGTWFGVMHTKSRWS